MKINNRWRLLGRSLLFLLFAFSESAWPRSTLAQADPLLFTLDWSTVTSDNTRGMAWGDVDNDGDLDLAVANWYQPNRLYRNDDGVLTTSSIWAAAEAYGSGTLAWGDVDHDGDLDLAVGNWDQPNQLYRNDDGVLSTTSVWSPAVDPTISMAWGDVDNDGDLDLATGQYAAPARLYRNDGGVLSPSSVWSSSEALITYSLAWGDMDSDGDLDLAASNTWHGDLNCQCEILGNRVYRNDAGSLTANPVWSSVEQDQTNSVAWGDVDSDGDLDLAVGNRGEYHPIHGDIREPNRLYRNDNGMLTTSAIWSSTEVGHTSSVAWGDVDGDGDLDLAVGNSAQPNQIYRNDSGALTMSSAWSADLIENTTVLVWGDVDGDGDLDLAAGNEGKPSRIYRNDNALLTRTAWSSSQKMGAGYAAWGDVDGDGDLDLALGQSGNIYLHQNNQGTLTVSPTWSLTGGDASRVAWGDADSDGDLDLVTGGSGLKLYRNDSGMLMDSPIWSMTEDTGVSSIAWGDVDGDGDLDLATGSFAGIPNRLYRNNAGQFTASAIWSSTETGESSSIAWGDVDNDGDLDLASGHFGMPTRLYRNDNGLLTTNAVWSSAEVDNTQDLAWGDIDNDGDLDLVTANRGPSRLYRNDQGNLTNGAAWSSVEADDAMSMALGDVDSDGDLDLMVGNTSPTNPLSRLYRNDHGSLTTTSVWTIAGLYTSALAWGDVDKDGDLDLLMADGLRESDPVALYQNLRRTRLSAINNPPAVHISRPGATDDAAYFSTPEILQSNNVTITYTLFDPEGDPVLRIFPEFSPSGGGQWFPATPGAGGDGLRDLAASLQGMTHTFVWRAEKDLIKSDNVVFRIRAQPGYTHSPILWPAVAGQSPSFRVEAPTYIKVIDESGNAVANANIFVNSQPAGLTNRAGLFNPGPLAAGTTIVALVRQADQPTVRGAHDGWAYRTYLTSLTWRDDGQTQPFTVGTQGGQRLVVRRAHPLVFFNLVVSIEWDADDSYLAQVDRAMHKMSDYLFDLTDGQMALAQVTIYDNGEHWADADIQIATKNVVRPHAYIGGLTASDPSQVISLGRGWDGRTSNGGAWDQPAGYRTLAHEFGHYALHLYDEYFFYLFDEQNNLIGEARAYCTGPNLQPATDATNASVMYYQYASSELSARGVPGLWSALCEETAQWQLNGGKSAWETLVRRYGDTTDPPRWRFITPSERGGVLAGPERLPAGLFAWPLVTVQNAGSSAPARPLTVYNPQGQPQEGVIVALYKAAGQVIGQGFTDRNGRLELYGATAGDTVRAASFDGGLAGSVAVRTETNLTLTLAPLAGLVTGSAQQTALAPPHLQVRAEPGPDPAQVELLVSLQNFGPGADPSLVVTEPNHAEGHAPILSYSPDAGIYQGTISFSATQRGLGRIRAVGEINNSLVRLHTTYRLQQVANDGQHHDLYSDDGNLNLHLAPDSLPSNEAYFVVMPPGATPGPLPAGLGLVGFPYAVTASGALAALVKPALLTLRYDPLLVNPGAASAGLGVYRWEPNSQTWQALPSTRDEEHTAVIATVTALGTYALLVPTESLHPPRAASYLPIIANAHEGR